MDLLNMARTARENLARGLNALQSPGVPPSLMSVAEPIAQAMGCMHRIEASRGNDLLEPAQTALGLARRALSELQAQAVPHPAVDQAIEAVAGSLGVIHQLTQAAPQHVSPPTQPSNALHYGAREPQPQVAIVGAPGAYPPAPQQHWQQPAPAAPQQHWQQPAPAPQPAPQQHWQQPAPAPQPAPQQHWQQPAPPPQPVAQQHWQQPAPPPQPVAQQHWQQPSAPAAQPGWQAQTVPAGTDPKGTLRFDAELGAHSATNFYKGLSGNDVIDSGGLFIATYQIPEIGRTVQLKVSLPGGYEFEALGVVRWTREAPESSAGDSTPGFGVQFTQISPEGRQLVYRYVRNREPIFHDDL